MDSAWLIWSAVFSLIGFAVFTSGRRQRRSASLLIGIVLMVYPYFVSSALALVGIGIALIGALVLGNRIESGV